jgi:hypothetical protein
LLFPIGVSLGQKKSFQRAPVRKSLFCIAQKCAEFADASFLIHSPASKRHIQKGDTDRIWQLQSLHLYHSRRRLIWSSLIDRKLTWWRVVSHHENGSIAVDDHFAFERDVQTNSLTAFVRFRKGIARDGREAHRMSRNPVPVQSPACASPRQPWQLPRTCRAVVRALTPVLAPALSPAH